MPILDLNRPRRPRQRQNSVKEQFRVYPKYSRFRISNHGRVQAYVYGLEAWVDKEPYRTKSGYPVIYGTINGKQHEFFIHRLVLELFVGPCPEGLIACHNDGNPSNNHVLNLRWDTYKSNTQDTFIHGTMHHGSKAGGAKLTEADVCRMRAMNKEGVKQKKLALAFGVSCGTVSRIINYERWTHI